MTRRSNGPNTQPTPDGGEAVPADEAQRKVLLGVAGGIWYVIGGCEPSKRTRLFPGYSTKYDPSTATAEVTKYFRIPDRPPFNSVFIRIRDEQTTVIRREVRPALEAEGTPGAVVSATSTYPLSAEARPYRTWRVIEGEGALEAELAVPVQPPEDAWLLDPLSSAVCLNLTAGLRKLQADMPAAYQMVLRRQY